VNLQSRIVFHHVARAGSFAGGAATLPFALSEAAVRKHIRQLEAELGVALCRRQPFGLTPEGRMLSEHDRPHLQALAQASLRLGRWTPRLRAGVTGSAAKRFLLPALHTWLRGKGRETVETRTGTLSHLLPALQSGELDLLITARDGRTPEGYASHTLATFPLVLVVPAASPLQSAGELWARPVIEDLLIAPEPNDPVTLAFERGLARGGLTWEARFTHDCPSAVVRLVADGLGFGLALAAEPVPRSRTTDGGLRKPEDRSAGGAEDQMIGMIDPRGEPLREAQGPEPVAGLKVLSEIAGVAGTTSRSLDANRTSEARSAQTSVLSRTPSGSSPSSAPGCRELPLSGFEPVPIVALWRLEDNLRLKEPLRLLREGAKS
jgi:DNA-binding transcriptional LysR family regulator